MMLLSDGDGEGSSGPCPSILIPDGAEEEETSKIGVAQLMGLTFFAVCGGPFGIELAVEAAGPAATLLALLIIPWVWSMPQALMCAELACMMPEDGGAIVWINDGLGRFWGFQNAWWLFASNLTDNSLYPLLFVDYLGFILPALSNPSAGRGGSFLLRYAVSLCLIALMVLMNIRGVSDVAWLSAGLTVAVMLPFLVLVSIGGSAAAGPAAAVWYESPPAGDIKFGVFYAIMLWSLSNFSGPGALAGNVANVKRTFPAAMTGAVVITQLTYLLPVGVGLAVEPNWRNWTDGYFTYVGQAAVEYSNGNTNAGEGRGGGSDHGGGAAVPWLSWWISIAGAVSAVGLLNTLLAFSSFQALGMAQLGFLPPMFAIRSKAGVPVPSILFHGLCCALLATLDFASVLQISNVFAQLSCLLNYTALLRLRHTQPERSRPYSVPFSLRNGSLQAFVAVPIVMCLMGIFLLEWLALVLALVWIVLVLILYYVSEKTDWLNRCTPQACTPQTSDEADNSMRRLLSRQVGRSDSFSQAAASVEMVDRDIQEELDKLNYNRPTRC